MKNLNFLQSVAKYIYDKQHDNLQEQVVVVPNIRAGLYLRRYLGEMMEGPGWSPEIISVQDFFYQQSDLKAEEPVPLVFELYKTFVDVKPGLFDSFDSFYPWGEIILSDFNDIDKNLANASQLFANLTDLKKIDLLYADVNEEVTAHIKKFWSEFEPDNNHYSKERFLEVWQHMLKVYDRYRKRLKEQKSGYEGMISRAVAENLDNALFPDEKPKYFFVGFNVLSAAEETVFRYFKNHHEAEFFWQYEENIIQDPHHEAFRFVRELIRKFPLPRDFSYDREMREKKVLNIYSVPSKTAQAKLASTLIEKYLIPVDPELEHSGLVLPDESLLHPVLYSVPESVKHVNVTMGFPISYAPQTSIIQILAGLQKNFSSDTWYHKDVLKVLNHPLVRIVSAETSQEIKNKIFRQNMIRISGEALKTGDTVLDEIFSHTEDVMETGEYFSRILKLLYEGMRTMEDVEFDKEIVYQMYRNINRFNEYLVKDRIYFKSAKTYLWLVSSMLNKLSVAFSGEPMRGLQVMGMLETRLIDFENLIILSMNEGHFPGQSFKKSFIPYNLRHAFNLPTIELQDAIHAYYFYRMILHPENVFLVYNSSDEGFNKGEKSRYIQQIMHELDAPVKEIPVFNQTESKKKSERVIEKDEFALSVLKQYTGSKPEKQFSPSQLNTYIKCSMAFYYKYILGIKEPDEMLEQIGNMELGNVLHQAMCELYKPYMNREVVLADIESMLKQEDRILSAVHDAYQMEMKVSKLDVSGINALGIEAVINYVKGILQTDKKRAPFVYLEGEMYCTSVFRAVKGDAEINCGFHGTIDRLERDDSLLRVIDYKTGQAKNVAKNKAMSDFFERNRKNEGDHVFQILFYTWLIHRQDEGKAYAAYRLYPMIMYTRGNKIISGFALDDKKPDDYRDVMEAFEAELSELIHEIFSPAVPFHMTEVMETCNTCPYFHMCH